MLNNNEKLFILYTKGWFRSIENAKELILADEYALHPDQVGEDTIMHFTMGLYHKLYKLGYILGNHPSPLMYMMEQVNRICKSPLAPNSLYQILYNDIQFIETDGLDLMNVEGLGDEYETNFNEVLNKFKDDFQKEKTELEDKLRSINK